MKSTLIIESVHIQQLDRPIGAYNFQPVYQAIDFIKSYCDKKDIKINISLIEPERLIIVLLGAKKEIIKFKLDFVLSFKNIYSIKPKG